MLDSFKSTNMFTILSRKAFEKAAFDYVEEHYENGCATVYGGKSGGKNVVTICISSSIFNPGNFW